MNILPIIIATLLQRISFSILGNSAVLPSKIEIVLMQLIRRIEKCESRIVGLLYLKENLELDCSCDARRGMLDDGILLHRSWLMGYEKK